MNLIELKAEALMEDCNMPMGAEVPLVLTVSVTAPRDFFALFEQDEKSTKSSQYFANRNNNSNNDSKRASLSKMTVIEAAFAFLQWAEYGKLPEMPEFSATAAKTSGDDDGKNHIEDDDVLLKEEDFAAEEGSDVAEQPEWAKSVNNAETDNKDNNKQPLPELDDPAGFDDAVVLRPYQRQALYWMMKREQEGESRSELESELALLSELASNQSGGSGPGTSWPTATNSNESSSQTDIICDCGPVLVSEAGKKVAKTLDGEANPLNHPLWKPRYMAEHGMGGAILFYVNELLGIATCHPPAPPKQCSGGILADDMGLGKTVMLLALILKYKEKQQAEGNIRRNLPTLVVAPLTLIAQWEEEIKTKTSLSCRVCYGDSKGKSSRDGFAVDIVITTYGTMQAEFQKQKKSNATDCGYGLLQRDWLRIILDEAHCIKNQATIASKACCTVKATYRWVVTGTVIHNSLDDVFGLLKFLQHQPWCEHAFWKTAITTEMNRVDKTDAEDGEKSTEPTGMMVALGRVRRLLGPLMLRRTKNSLSADGKPILTLPPVETKVINVNLTPAEREFYNALLARSQDIFDGFIKEGTASKSWLAIFSLLHRLRMSCDHISLTVKAHLDEDDSDTAFTENKDSDDLAKTLTTKATKDSVDDAFISGLLQKFRKASQGNNRESEESQGGAYSEKVAHALNSAIKDNATHVAEECPICLDAPLIHEACITSCAHIFCRKCLLDVLKEKAPATGSKSSFAPSQFPDGNCPVCQSKVESSKVILLGKDKEGEYTSRFLADKKQSPLKRRKLKDKNDDDDDEQPAIINESSRAARQILQNAVNGAESAKQARIMAELLNIWELDPGSNVVIFSQYLGFLSILETSLRQGGIPFGRLDGKMSLKQRVAALEAFKTKGNSSVPPSNDGNEGGQPTATTNKERRGSVMLVSMKAGGVGLNMCSAATVFLCDPWWSNALEEQCINRVHRIGQTAEVVRVRKFVVEDSVEERIVELQLKKKGMANEVYSDSNRGAMTSSKPTMDDFKMIFRNIM